MMHLINLGQKREFNGIGLDMQHQEQNIDCFSVWMIQ